MINESFEDQSEKVKSSMYELSRKMLLAGIGAAVLAQEEIERYLTRMVERGEIAEKDARSLFRELLDRRSKTMAAHKAEQQPASTVAATKADIEALTAKIIELNRKIEELKKAQKP